MVVVTSAENGADEMATGDDDMALKVDVGLGKDVVGVVADAAVCGKDWMCDPDWLKDWMPETAWLKDWIFETGWVKDWIFETGWLKSVMFSCLITAVAGLCLMKVPASVEMFWCFCCM